MRLWALAFVFGLFVAVRPAPGAALPVFAHRYGLSCEACHSTVPRLNAFGQAFREGGFSLPGARGVAPIAVKVNLAYGTDRDPAGLPKAVVDEVELLSGGSIGKNTNYFIEQYVVDGGRPGLPRDAWLRFRAGEVHVKTGQFELPLPVDIESSRDTLAHYALYDQTVGINTFRFFDPRLGVDADAGNDRGFHAHVALLHAYDRGTSTPRSGVDVMGSLSKTIGDFVFQTYRYHGQRNFAIQDRFWRHAFSAKYEHGQVTLTGVLQTGNDSSADGAGNAARSSGGFAESAYRFSDGLSAVVRYEGTGDTLAGMQRQFVAALIVRPKRNMRFTVEGVQNAGHTSASAGFLFAY